MKLSELLPEQAEKLADLAGIKIAPGSTYLLFAHPAFVSRVDLYEIGKALQTLGIKALTVPVTPDDLKIFKIES